MDYTLNLKIDFLEYYSSFETIILPFIPRKGDLMSLYDKEEKINITYDVDYTIYIFNQENYLESIDVYLISG